MYGHFYVWMRLGSTLWDHKSIGGTVEQPELMHDILTAQDFCSNRSQLRTSEVMN